MNILSNIRKLTMRDQSAIDNYISHLFAPEDDHLKQISIRLKAYDDFLYRIQIQPSEARLIQIFMNLVVVKTAVEIGSLAGYSATWIARALPADGLVHAINKDPDHYNLLQQAAKDEPRIKPHLGNASEVLKQLSENAPYDMVFIDADKGGYAHYLDWAEKHVRKGGLIIGDNTLLFGHVLEDEYPAGDKAPSRKAWSAMREFNQRLSDESKYNATLVPTKEGMTVAIKLF